jgi:DNA-binding transcriptional regulator YiaG
MPTAAEEVRAIRERLGLTAAELAKRLGVTTRAVQHWEAGTREPGGAALKLMRRMRPRRSRP